MVSSRLWRVQGHGLWFRPALAVSYDTFQAGRLRIITLSSEEGWDVLSSLTQEVSMIENFFEAPRTLQRLRASPVGPFVDGFAEWLHEQGYSRGIVRSHLCTGQHLGVWMTTERLSLQQLDEAALAAFGRHSPGCRCLRRDSRVDEADVVGARLWLRFLRERGVIAQPSSVEMTEHPVLVRQFDTWMHEQRGVTASTLVCYRRVILKLVGELGEPEGYTAVSLRQFVLGRAALHGRDQAKTVVTAVRMFLRFLASQGLCDPWLIEAIPTIAHWRLSSLPVYLAPEEVERLLRTPDQTTVKGRRNRAILLLLARLGLRAGDVAGLRLGDLDWEAGVLLVTGKSRRAERLPLPQEVGDAILAYLPDRPVGMADDHVFFCLQAPHRPIRFSSSISAVVDRAARQAGITPPRGGAHVLRHSFATTMLRRGMPLAVLGALLRHRGEDTTAHYAKVDVAALRQVVRPWPVTVTSC